MDVVKLPASAGAEWLLGGFALLRRSPLGLGLLGAIFGALAAIVGHAGLANPMWMMPLQLLMALLGPLLVAGMVWAAREVDQGRAASPAHLLRGLQDGKAGRLLMTLLPQVAAGLLAVLLLLIVVGPGELQKLLDVVERAQGQPRPDPSLFAGLALGRFWLWLLLALAVGILAGFFNFTAIPDMMFSGAGALDAMMRSFRACLRNLPAMLVFFVLLIIAVIALSIASALVGGLLNLVAGQALSQFLLQVLLMAVLMPVVTGAMYVAWKRMVAGQPAERLPASGGFEA